MDVTNQSQVIVETDCQRVVDLYLFLIEIVLIFVAILTIVVKRTCAVDDVASNSHIPTALETPAASAGESKETVHKDVGQAVVERDFRVLRKHFERLHTADTSSEGKTSA